MSIGLEILGYTSTDVRDLAVWEPQSLDEVYFPLHIEIGQSGMEGGALFQVLIATPEALRRFGDLHGQISDRNLLVCLQYDWPALDRRIRRIVAGCQKDTWHESIQSLQRFFEWEHESLKSAE